MPYLFFNLRFSMRRDGNTSFLNIAVCKKEFREVPDYNKT